MSNITVNFKKNTIVVSKAFAKKASQYGSEEYREFQKVKSENPKYKVEIKNTRPPKKNTIRGLDYQFMERYIKNHNMDLYKEFLTLIGKSDNEYDGLKVKGKPYLTVKKWFLEKFPEIAEFESIAKKYSNVG